MTEKAYIVHQADGYEVSNRGIAIGETEEEAKEAFIQHLNDMFRASVREDECYVIGEVDEIVEEAREQGGYTSF